MKKYYLAKKNRNGLVQLIRVGNGPFGFGFVLYFFHFFIFFSKIYLFMAARSLKATLLLTHISLASFLCDIGKQYRQRLIRVSTVCIQNVLSNDFNGIETYYPTTLNFEIDSPN